MARREIQFISKGGEGGMKRPIQKGKKWWAINRKLKVNSCLFYFIGTMMKNILYKIFMADDAREKFLT